MNVAAVGFTVKSGWACAILLTGPPASPRVVESARVELSDPESPASRQPYHEGFGTARAAGSRLAIMLASVKRCGRQSVTELLRRYQAQGYALKGAGLVVGSLIEPERIGNDHIRIHALEGQLFRGIIQDAAAEHEVACSLWRERDLYAVATDTLVRSDDQLRANLTALGRSIGGPWRAEHKAATVAAWLVLSARKVRPRS